MAWWQWLLFIVFCVGPMLVVFFDDSLFENKHFRWFFKINAALTVMNGALRFARDVLHWI